MTVFCTPFKSFYTSNNETHATKKKCSTDLCSGMKGGEAGSHRISQPSVLAPAHTTTACQNRNLLAKRVSGCTVNTFNGPNDPTSEPNPVGPHLPGPPLTSLCDVNIFNAPQANMVMPHMQGCFLPSAYIGFSHECL